MEFFLERFTLYRVKFRHDAVEEVFRAFEVAQRLLRVLRRRISEIRAGGLQYVRNVALARNHGLQPLVERREVAAHQIENSLGDRILVKERVALPVPPGFDPVDFTIDARREHGVVEPVQVIHALGLDLRQLPLQGFHAPQRFLDLVAIVMAQVVIVLVQALAGGVRRVIRVVHVKEFVAQGDV